MESINDHSSIRLTRFFMNCIGMWQAKTKCQKILAGLRLSTPMITVWILGYLMIYNTMRPLTLVGVSEGLPILLVMVQEFAKLVLFAYYRQDIMDLNKFTETTFWCVKYGPDDLAILKKCNKICFTVYYIRIVTALFTAWTSALAVGIDNIKRNETERQLTLEQPVGFDQKTSPLFEFYFILQLFLASWSSMSSCTTSGWLFTITMYASAQFKILKRNIEVSGTNSISDSNESKKSLIISAAQAYDRLTECIKKHYLLIAYIDRIENIICYALLVQTLCTVLQICFISIQFLIADRSLIGHNVVTLVAFLIKFYILIYSCHEVMESSEAVRESTYNASWYDFDTTYFGRAYKQGLLIIMIRVQRPCVLTVGKFTPLTYLTFASVINSSISYFTAFRAMM